ncbi:hypothetical protein R3P38DRAFT_3240432 [Favolaschia claudopus]|uniref:F-box domain-containing protein n=1 Tax=Favolaschia claudopus TaxID=2862362 RepID=A0AAV9Z830_9AGAR
MPVEVVARILLLACGDFDEDPRAYMLARYVVCQVCVLWRNVVCSDARFWSGVLVGDHRTLPVLDLWLARSKRAPLHLFIDTGTYAVNWRSFASVWASLLSIIPCMVDRVDRFSLKDDHGDRGAVVLHWLSSLAASTASRLDVFTVMPTKVDARVVERGRGRWSRTVDLSKPSTPLHLLRAACLTSLVVQRSFLVLQPSMLSGLRRLRLGPIPSYQRLTWDSVRSMLLACSVLDLFVCDDVRCEYGSFGECEMPCLTHFRLVSRHWSAESIFAALRLPSLRVLYLDGYAPMLGLRRSDGTRSFFPSVEVLVVKCSMSRPCDFHLFLRGFAGLKTLVLRQLSAPSRAAFLSIKQSVRTSLTVEEVVGSSRLPDRLCPLLASVCLDAALTVRDAEEVLSDTPPAVFSPSCVLSYALRAPREDGDSGAFRLVHGEVVAVPFYNLPLDALSRFDYGFCE